MLILVNSDDEVIGNLTKSRCHDGDGALHRALSVFILNGAGEVLLQRRHPDKRLWGGYWSNSCCSHPRWGEAMQDAAQRRIHDELGLDDELEFVYKFEYHARFGEAGAEHELCHVFIGTTLDEPVVNTTEIADWRWADPAQLDQDIDQSIYTPWLRQEWRRLRQDFASKFAR